MDMHKKPFYKRVWFYVICLLTLGLLALFVIPYGLNHRSIGAQLVDTASQFKNVYMGDEKDNWTEDQWNDYWAEHPEYTADTSDIDFESFPDGNTPEDPRLDELPYDYSKLWNIDFSDLEKTEQYDAYSNHPITDKDGKPLIEEFIYREKSTGDQIIDVTLDGFILRLPPEYRAGWKVRSESDPNGFEKFEKAQNLEIVKNIGDKACHIEIAPFEWTGGPYKEEGINDSRYKLNMKTALFSIEDDSPERFLVLKLDHTPYNTDTYSIQISSTSPKECFDANLEREIVDGMTFLPPELREQGMDYDEVHRFPIPFYWPKKLGDEVKISQNNERKLTTVEYDGFKVKVDPSWQVEYGDEQRKGIKVIATRRCEIFLNEWSEWKDQIKEAGAKNLDEYYKIISKEINFPNPEVESQSTTNKKISESPYEVYKGQAITNYGDGNQIVYGGYGIKHKERIINIDWQMENTFESIRTGDCDAYGESIFQHFEFLE